MVMADVSTCNQDATQALFAAIYEGRHDKVIDAIYEGANVNACEDGLSGYTPLTLAFELGGGGKEVDGIYLELFQHGADVHLANAWGATPLISALSVKQTTWAMTFLSRGVDVNARGIVDDRLTSPLHEAAYWGLLDMVDWLIQAGADVEQKAHKRMLPQAYARTNPANGPVVLTRLARALDVASHPVMSLWRHSVDRRYVRWSAFDHLERLPTNWTYMCTSAIKEKNWYQAVLCMEMGAMVSVDVEVRLREKRYLVA